MDIMRYQAPWGGIVLGAEDESLTGLWIDGQKHYPNLDGAAYRETITLRSAREWLDAYFAGEKPPLTELALSPKGSVFQKEVWQILREIPYGRTITYGAIAGKIAKARGIPSMSAQAVGGAVGRNPISIIIPCHRVLGSDGSLTGYAGGIEIKKWLLHHEGVL